MTRLVVLGLLIVVLWLAVKSFTSQVNVSAFGQSPGRPVSPPSRAAIETLVRCARCGVYVTASRALQGNGEEAFCSEACVRSSTTRANMASHPENGESASSSQRQRG
jgi:hypothetical protein